MSSLLWACTITLLTNATFRSLPNTTLYSNDSSFYHTMYVHLAARSAELLFSEWFHSFCSDGLLLSYHHECLPLSLLPVGGAATRVQFSLLEPILLSSLPTSLKGGEGREGEGRGGEGKGGEEREGEGRGGEGREEGEGRGRGRKGREGGGEGGVGKGREGEGREGEGRGGKGGSRQV